ncbi:MAG: hypothetical protein IQL11_02195 [Bacteroidales bacterium]|nr:hypothetical protein [Bacteroidales bacterium]
MELNKAKAGLNPFPGLRPFLPEESNIFFGRSNESEEVLNRLLTNRFVTVIGASGSGKSSLVYSGVIPRLLKHPGQDKPSWKIIPFRPGKDPLENMAKAFAKAIPGSLNVEDIDPSFITGMKDDPNWIVTSLKKLAPQNNEKILLIVDQFEELFIYNQEETGISPCKTASEFVSMLENAVVHNSDDIYIIVTMRSDFVGSCATFQGFTRMINDSNFLVPRMTWENYKSVIEGPVRYAGAEIEPRLVVTVLNDLGDRTDQLPVLQHTMMRTYSHWLETAEPGRPVSIADYNAAGTISGAMSRHANEAFDELDPKGKDICKRMFKAITGKGSDNRGIRHPSAISTLKSVIRCSDKELLEVIEKFRAPSRSFITPVYPAPLNDNTVIDLTHESLIRLWGRLKEWVDDEASSVRMYMQLSEASAMYQQGKATLLKNPDLQLAVSWRENQKPTLGWAERYDPAFERAMVYLRTSEKAFLDEEQNKVIIQKRKIKGSRIIAMILGGAAVVFLGFMLVAFVQKISSDRQKNEALRQKEEAAAQAFAALQNSELMNMKLAAADSSAAAAIQNISEVRRQKEISDSWRSVAEQNAAEASRLADSARQASIVSEMNARIAEEQKALAVSRRLVAIGKSLSLKSLQMTGRKDLQSLLAYQGYMFNRDNGGLPNDADIYTGLYKVAREYGSPYYKTFTGHDSEIKSIAFLPGKREFFTAGADGKVLKWNLDGRNQSLQIVYSGTEIINVLAVSPDEGWLACGGQNAGIKMIPLKGNDAGYELKGHSESISSVIFSFDGRYLYSASSDGKVLKWDLLSRSSTDISTSMAKITGIDLSSDNRYIAGVSTEGKVVLWNPEKTSDNYSIESPGRTVRSVRFKPGKDLLAIGYDDGYLEIWDIATRKRVSEVQGHSAEVSDIRFNSKFSQIATAGNDGTLKLWDSDDLTSLPISFSDNDGLVVAIEFSPDGQAIVSGTTGGKTNLASRAAIADLLAGDVCSVVARNFTMDEWIAYVGKDIEYQRTCADKEFNIKVKEVR